ncbi:MAG: Eco57I restriction-modification methylase domain-containing protein, partial [Candidatus Kapaibacteriota bacterium]
LQNWYFWAMDKIKFPDDYKYSDDPEKDKEIRNATTLIRLITRIIFIWFIKEKGLIPEELFSKELLKNIVKDFLKGKQASNFYNAILQNLFFATLNQKMNERKFADDKGFPANIKEYGIKNLYRYADKFLIDKDKVLELFKDIPFLNGGLFDCLDFEDETGKVIYIDGFSRNENKSAKIPDYLFFQEHEESIDLSNYGLGKGKPVRGLIEILNSYNFTIDENTPIDQEIALDPELLGKVFENLLASYNPETATTARKATGSYYTPREIVDYMVEASLLEYLKTKHPGVDEEKIKTLLSYSENVPEFSKEEKQKIIESIADIKILDPACGSGAFPMGILHRLVFILQKLDPDNKFWYELQYQKALKETEEVFKESDKLLREERLKEINESFDEKINFPDYARKLYLIENCIYGVDIQPIAIQISKLRFFISLILDQKIDRSKENFGIRPLPNLETKFVAANTLIGLEKPRQLTMRDPEIEKKEKEIKEVRHKYFTAKTRSEKLKFQEKDKQLREEIAQLLIKDGWGDTSAKRIASLNLFDQNASADWFDPEWMFGVTDGFDIVIGNPPYIRQESIKELKPLLQTQGYQVFNATADIYTYFYEKGYQVLKYRGLLCFITSNKWMRARYGENLRKLLKEKTRVIELIDFSGYSVFEQTVDTNIITLQKVKPQKGNLISFLNVKSDIDNVIDYIKNNKSTILQEKLSDNTWTLAEDKVLAIKEKIEKIGTPLKEWDVKIYYGIKTGYNEAFIIDTETRNRILDNCKTEEERKRTEEIIKPILRGRDIKRYYYKWAGLWLIKIESGWTNEKRGKEKPEEFFKKMFPSVYQHLISYANKTNEGRRKGLLNRDDQGDYWWELRDCDYYPEFEKEKIVWQEMTNEGSFAWDTNKIYVNQTCYIMTNANKYILALLNSKIVHFYFSQISYALGIGAFRWIKQFVERLPIPKIPESEQQPFISLVDKMLELNQRLNQLGDKITDERGRIEEEIRKTDARIDELVYQIYNITPEERKIIEESLE